MLVKVAQAGEGDGRAIDVYQYPVGKRSIMNTNDHPVGVERCYGTDSSRAQVEAVHMTRHRALCYFTKIMIYFC